MTGRGNNRESAKVIHQDVIWIEDLQFFQERLDWLDLALLKYRRLKGDLTELNEIMREIVRVDSQGF